ncbi:MAG: hypothetical protein HS107_14825 [Thermoflexaceae bacterium]|nr:hypothetical protein [Thermoflexaceae bacterium]
MASRHGWASWDQYISAHQRYLDQFAHFIEVDTLNPVVTESAVEWTGVLACSGGIEIHVRKLQVINLEHGRFRVRTRLYSYHVLARKGEAIHSLFRYDNVHMHPGHPDAHHRHHYDEHGIDQHPPQHIGEEDWPTLADVVAEAERHYLRRLSDPTSR